jgi:hypothetical protein
MEKEEWRPIPNFEGVYEVSSYGKVKSLRFNKELILKQRIGTRGYFIVGLYDNKTITRDIHQLVAESFLNHKPCGLKLVVDHINNNRLDNRVENLRIVTQRENANKKHIKSTSKYTGVHWQEDNKKWRASIIINGKKYYLGLFTNEYDAHLAYQNKLNSL